MADNIPVAEFFARMGLDASDFVNEVRGAREYAKQEFEAMAKETEGFQRKIQRIISGEKIVGPGTGITSASYDAMARLGLAGADLDKQVKILTDEFVRFKLGLNSSDYAINKLGASLRGLGTSDIELKFAKMQNQFQNVQRAFDAGLISDRTYNDAKSKLDSLSKAVQQFQSGKGTGFPKADEQAALKATEARRRYEENYTKWWFGEIIKKEQAEKRAADKSIAEAQRAAAAKRAADESYINWWQRALIQKEQAEKAAAQRAQVSGNRRADRTTIANFQEEATAHQNALRAREKAIAEETRLERMMGQARREMDADFLKRAAAKQAAVRKLGTDLVYAGQTMQQFGNFMTFSVTLPMAAAAIGIIKVTSQLETMRAVLTRSTGSADLGNSVLLGLREFVNQAPLGIDQVNKMTRRIQELRVSSRPATETLRILGDAVFALGGGEPEIERVVKAFGDIQAAGKLAGQEVRQLVNANIPAIQILAQELGRTPSQIKSMMREGALDAETTIEALMKGLNKRFGGEMANRMNTIAGEWQRLKNMLTFTLQDLGTSQLPLIKDLLSTAQGFLKVIADAGRGFASLDTSTQKLILGAAAAVALVGPLSRVAGILTSGWGRIIKQFTDLTTVIGTAGTAGTLAGGLASLPFLAKAAFVAGIGAAAYFAWQKIADVNKNLDKTYGLMERLGSSDFQTKAAEEMATAANAKWRAREVSPGNAWNAAWGADVPGHEIRLKNTNVGDEEDPEEKLRKIGQARQQAFSALGLEDYNTKIKETTAAFRTHGHLLSSMQKELAHRNWATFLKEAMAAGAIGIERYSQLLSKIPAILKDAETNALGFRNADFLQSGMDALARGVQAFQEQQRLVDLPGRRQNIITPDLLGKLSQGLDAQALDMFNIKPDEDLEFMASQLKRVYDLHAQGKVRVDQVNKATLDYYRAAIKSGRELNSEQKQHYETILRQVEGVRRMEAMWKGIKNQVSTILTDFSRSAIDILIPRSSSDKPAFASDILSGLERGYSNIAGAGYSNPRAALEQTLNQIKNATTLIEANRIAIRAFGDVGPQIAKGLRDGSISGDKLASTLDKISSSLDETNQKTSKFTQLMDEVKRAILRAFAEEAAKAVADFVGKHLRRLISNMDEILAKIPLIGRGLEKIFGLGGNKGGFDISQVPNIGTGSGAGMPQIPGYPGTIPGGSTSPRAPGGGGGASSLLSGINVATGIVSAVADVFSAVGIIRLEGTMNAVEWNTRKSSLHLEHMLTGPMNNYMPELKNIREYLLATFHPAFVELLSKGGSGGGSGDVFNIYINGDSILGGDAEAVAMLETGARELRRRGYRGSKG